MKLSNLNKSASLLLSIFMILTWLLCLGGYILYRYEKKNITIEKHNELAAINKIKVEQIVYWRKERLQDALGIMNDQAVINHINEYIHGIDHEANFLTITRWIKSILEEPDYSVVFLADPSGKIIFNSNPAKLLTKFDKLYIKQAERTKGIVFSDLLKYNNKDIFIDIAIPLFINAETHGGFSGVVLIRIDPKKFLYPVILSWPTPSRTSEILLIRREGDSALFLSGLQHNKNSAFLLRKSMTDTNILSVQALTGKVGIFEGIDYRGVRVLGDAHPVPGSTWFIVTKVDIDEIYHPISTLAFRIFIITFLLILIAALIIYVVWSRQLNKTERERNLAVEKLHTSEEGFRTLAESVPQFVWVAEADGMISYFNQRWAEYTGLTLEESYDTGWNQPYHPDDRQRAWDAWKHSTEIGIKYDQECRLRKYNGNYHWFIIRGEPLRDSSGDIIKWYGTCTDIDNQKQIEKEIKILNEELEAFSYSVSHDLRAPLQNIEGWSMRLLEHNDAQLDEQGHQCMDHVRSETLRMKNLIDALLKLSRLGRTELTKVQVDLTVLAHDITDRLLKDASDRQIKIIIQPGMVTYGDLDMLEVVLTNLLSNAFKFTGKQPLAQIEFGQSLIDGKQTFWIRDNGAGFDMAHAKNLFGAFQRMHKQSDFPGTGIGLATVQRIIHRHDGQIRAESKINEGTTFYFTLPDEIR